MINQIGKIVWDFKNVVPKVLGVPKPTPNNPLIIDYPGLTGFGDQNLIINTRYVVASYEMPAYNDRETVVWIDLKNRRIYRSLPWKKDAWAAVYDISDGFLTEILFNGGNYPTEFGIGDGYAGGGGSPSVKSQYLLGLSFSGTITESDSVLALAAVAKNCTIPQNAAGSVSISDTPTNIDYTLNILKNDETIGTITFSNGSSSGTFQCNSTSLTTNDVVKIVAPSANPSLTNVATTILTTIN